MRSVFLVLVLSACSARPAGHGTTASRPGVMPMLSELPGDADRRNAILDSSNQVAGPEHRKGMTRKERKAETIGATAAAILGSVFSKTQNVTLGGALTFGGRDATGPVRQDEDKPAADKAQLESDERAKLPWIRLTPD